MTTQAHALPDTGRLEADDAKDRLRRHLRDQRRSRHPHPAQGHAPACPGMTEHALQALDGARRVAAYVSVGVEPCTRQLLSQLHAAGVEVLLPVLGPQLARSWGRFTGLEDLAERAPGRPPEPGGPALPAEAVAQVDALVVPALAVDRSGNRLGQGGGWYDRMLPLRAEGVRVFAMVYPDELVEGPLPVEGHDAPVDAVITHEEWFLLEGSTFAGRR